MIVLHSFIHSLGVWWIGLSVVLVVVQQWMISIVNRRHEGVQWDGTGTGGVTRGVWKDGRKQKHESETRRQKKKARTQ